MSKLYPEHIRSVTEEVKKVLVKNKIDSLILHSGSINYYHADDLAPAFRAIPHFVRFAPASAPDHFIIINADEGMPVYIETIPDDFWIEYPAERNNFWKSEFSHRTVKSSDDAWKAALETARGEKGFIGDEKSSGVAKAKGIKDALINADRIISELNELRAIKTEHEIECIRHANERASFGHVAARDAFMSGASELEIHYAFLRATRTTEEELPYPTVVALNEKPSVLHYQRKRDDERNGKTFLIDAGVNHLGYASDITRTYSKNAHPMFETLLSDIQALQKMLCEKVKPGAQFIELHHEAHLGIADILKKNGFTTVGGEDSIKIGVTRAFFPHGLGHMLGIQVHDVGGVSDEGFQHQLRELYPKIRTNRTLAAGNVTTIEPGLYFIPMLLAPLRKGATKEKLNWKLIEELTPCGGIRIEDNLVVTKDGAQNLTKEYLS